MKKFTRILIWLSAEKLSGCKKLIIDYRVVFLVVNSLLSCHTKNLEILGFYFLQNARKLW